MYEYGLTASYDLWDKGIDQRKPRDIIMTYASKARTLIRKLGATIEGGRCGDTWDYTIDAPRHHAWVSNEGLHGIVAWCFHGADRQTDSEWREDMWKDAYERMSYGIEPCPIEDCEMCLDDENWPD